MLEALEATHRLHAAAVAATSAANTAFDPTMARLFGDRFQMAALLDFLAEPDSGTAQLRDLARDRISRYLASVDPTSIAFRQDTGDRRWTSVPVGKTRRHRINRILQLALDVAVNAPGYAVLLVDTPAHAGGRCGVDPRCWIDAPDLGTLFSRILEICVAFDPIPFETRFDVSGVLVGPVRMAVGRYFEGGLPTAHARIAARRKIAAFAPEADRAEIGDLLSEIAARVRRA